MANYDNSLTVLAARLRPLILGAVNNVPSTSTGGGNFPYFVHPWRGYNVTDVAAVDITATSNGVFGIRMVADKKVVAGSVFVTPPGYSGTITVTPLAKLYSTVGDYVLTNDSYTTVNLATGSTISTSTGSATITSDGTWRKITEVAFTVAVASPTLVKPYFTRFGLSAGDTSTEVLDFYGWLITY